MSSHDLRSFVESVNSSFLDCERGCKSIISDSDLDSNTCNYPEWGRASEADADSTSSPKTMDIQTSPIVNTQFIDNTELSRTVRHSANLAMWRSHGHTGADKHINLSILDRENIRQALTCETTHGCTDTIGWLEMRSDIDADIMFPIKGEVFELARTNPWQLGNPRDSVTVINDLSNDNSGPQEVPITVASERVAEMTLDDKKVTCQRREEGPCYQDVIDSPGGPRAFKLNDGIRDDGLLERSSDVIRAAVPDIHYNLHHTGIDCHIVNDGSCISTEAFGQLAMLQPTETASEVAEVPLSMSSSSNFISKLEQALVETASLPNLSRMSTLDNARMIGLEVARRSRMSTLDNATMIGLEVARRLSWPDNSSDVIPSKLLTNGLLLFGR